jgi:ketosteroid isomerase-like protein
MKIFLTFLLFTGFLANSFSQSAAGPDSLSIQQAVVQLFDGIAKIDSASIAAHVTKDFLLLEDGQVWNTDSLFRVLKPMKNQDFTRTNEFRFVSQQLTGNISWIAYYNTAHIEFNGQKRDINWLESAVLEKENSTWKVKMLHSTMLRKPSGR